MSVSGGASCAGWARTSGARLRPSRRLQRWTTRSRLTRPRRSTGWASTWRFLMRPRSADHWMSPPSVGRLGRRTDEAPPTARSSRSGSGCAAVRQEEVITDGPRLPLPVRFAVIGDLLRSHGSTGRPLGTDAFVESLEQRRRRRVKRAKPGPKPRERDRFTGDRFDE